LQAPPYPWNWKPEPGAAVKVIFVPGAKLAEQLVGQLMPAGLLVTVPVPLTLTDNCGFWVCAFFPRLPHATDPSTSPIERRKNQARGITLTTPFSRNLGASVSRRVACQPAHAVESFEIIEDML
jgi:hypothetical protein